MGRTALVIIVALLAGACDEAVSRRPEAGSPRDATGVEAQVGDLAQDGSAADLAALDSATSSDGAPMDLVVESAPDVAPTSDTKPKTSEILLFDGDNRQFTVADNGFHPLIQPGDALPAANWLAPIDYYNGEIQIRYVINSPSTQVAGKLQVCFWTMGNGDGDGKNYFPESCSDQVSHTGVGTYFNTKPTPASWWQNAGVPLDFTHPQWFLIRVVLRGTSGCNVTTYNVANACWNEWPSYQNMKFRVTMVMVGKGDTFSGWSNYP
jgi:hypothetical protein